MIHIIGSRTTTKIQKMKCNTNSYLLNYAWLALQMSEIRLVGTFGAWIESPILSKLGLAFWSALGRSRRKCTPIKTENQRFFFMKIKNLRFLIFFYVLFLWSSYVPRIFMGSKYSALFLLAPKCFFPGPNLIKTEHKENLSLSE